MLGRFEKSDLVGSGWIYYRRWHPHRLRELWHWHRDYAGSDILARFDVANDNTCKFNDLPNECTANLL